MTAVLNRRSAILGGAALVAGCGPRPGGFAPLAGNVAAHLPTQKVLSIVHRAPTGEQGKPPTRFSTRRSSRPYFASYDVSVPPTHRKGRLELGSPADPDRHFAMQAAREYSAEEFAKALRTGGAADAELTLFVHGFNYTHAESVMRQAQIKEDFELRGPHVLFSWASLGSPVGYVHDRDSAAYARDGLEAAIRMVTEQQPRPVVLIAHSMGAWLVMETLRQIAISRRPLRRPLGGLALISPDIDISVFRQQVTRIGKLPDPTFVIVSQADRALQISARLSGRPQRLGNLSDLDKLRRLGVIPVDLSAISDGERGGHFNAATSPTAITLLAGLREGVPIDASPTQFLAQATSDSR